MLRDMRIRFESDSYPSFNKREAMFNKLNLIHIKSMVKLIHVKYFTACGMFDLFPQQTSKCVNNRTNLLEYLNFLEAKGDSCSFAFLKMYFSLRIRGDKDCELSGLTFMNFIVNIICTLTKKTKKRTKAAEIQFLLRWILTTS
jgi:hypothetical protein